MYRQRTTSRTWLFLTALGASHWASIGCGLLPAPTEPDEQDATAGSVLLARTLPQLRAEEQLVACVGVSAAAAELTGAQDFVLSGTVDARGNNPTYSASPSDELVFRAPDVETRYRITRMRVSTVQNASELFLNDHDVRCRAIRSGEFNLDMSSSLANNASQRAVSGFVDDGTQSFTADLAETGSSTTEFDNGLLQYRSASTRRGSITSGDIEVEVEETDNYVVVVGDDAIENRTTEVTMNASAGDVRFAMDDGTVRRAFKNGAAAESDFWSQTAGVLQKDGADFGTLAFVNDRGAFQIVLETPEGRTVLETHR